MRIGVDLDNTIVCYDGLFHAAAVARTMVPSDTPCDKTSVRDYLRTHGREDEWTRLQGVVYGQEMHQAKPFAGAVGALRRAARKGWPVAIISHRTRTPFLGPQTDLHASALDWLEQNEITTRGEDAGPAPQVFLELTREAKMQRIADWQCDVFVDDLPEFLGDREFPAGVRKVWFNPAGRVFSGTPLESVGAWAEIQNLLGLHAS